MTASVIPDPDGISFWTNILYASAFEHHGLSHSLLFVLVCGLAGSLFHRFLKTKTLKAFLFIIDVILSHIFLDTLTNGGLGTVLFWPVSNERFFLPFRPIEVSPVTLPRLLSSRGLQVLVSELKWVWPPMLAVFIFLLPIGWFTKTKRT